MYKKDGKWEFKDIPLYHANNSDDVHTTLNKELFEERAAILEYMHGFTRKDAELEAISRYYSRKDQWN